MAKTYIGADLGSSTIKLAVCTAGSATQLISEPVLENLVSDQGRITSLEAMADFIKGIISKHHITTKDVALALPSFSAFSKKITLPAMTMDQLKLNLPYEFQDYISQELGADAYYYDHALLEMRYDEANNPVEMDLMVSAILKTSVDSCRNLAAKSALKLAVAAPCELVFGNLIEFYEEKQPDNTQSEYCIIDFGHLTTKIYIYKGSHFEVSRIIEFGGYAVTEAIATALSVDLHKAEALKLANEDNINNSEACHTIYGKIAVEAMRAVNFYGFNNRDSNIVKIHYCGGGSNIPQLLAAVEESTGLPLCSIDEIMPSGRDGIIYSSAIGITLQ